MNFITGEKFAKISNFIYSIKVPSLEDYYNYPNTCNKNNIENYTGTPIIYTHTQYAQFVLPFIAKLNKKVILLTHNSDYNITDALVSKLPENVIKWYAQNVNVSNPRIESIPIGLENEIWFPHLRKKEQMLKIIQTPKKHKGLMYVNHNVSTNRTEREAPYQIFKDSSWVKLEYGSNGSNFQTYLDNLYNYKFVLCPDGNGIDTHRLWETLYLNTIPVVKRSINTNFYTELPICYVDKWEDITEDFLNKEYERLLQITKRGQLNFDYWRKKIITDGIS